MTGFGWAARVGLALCAMVAPAIAQTAAPPPDAGDLRPSLTASVSPETAQAATQAAARAAALAGPARPLLRNGNRADYDPLVRQHAKVNGVPESLIHRVIVRESRYQPHLVSRGNIGLMQIKLATARGVGYGGDAEGLRDPETNLTYAVKYLAGAWRVAEGNADRAVFYYARGYYNAEKALKARLGSKWAAMPPVPRDDKKLAAVSPAVAAAPAKPATALAGASATGAVRPASKPSQALALLTRAKAALPPGKPAGKPTYAPRFDELTSADAAK